MKEEVGGEWLQENPVRARARRGRQGRAAAAAGVETVFLSAGDEDVARVYERVGFRRVGSVGEAAQASER